MQNTIRLRIGTTRSHKVPLPDTFSPLMSSACAVASSVMSPFCICASSSYFCMGPKSSWKATSTRIMMMVRIAYKLKGMVDRNVAMPPLPSSGRLEITLAAHDETGAMMHTGAAVASIK